MAYLVGAILLISAIAVFGGGPATPDEAPSGLGGIDEQPDNPSREAVTSTDESLDDCDQRPFARSLDGIAAKELDEYLSPEDIDELRERQTACDNLRQRHAAFEAALQYCKQFQKGDPASLCSRVLSFGLETVKKPSRGTARAVEIGGRGRAFRLARKAGCDSLTLVRTGSGPSISTRCVLETHGAAPPEMK